MTKPSFLLSGIASVLFMAGCGTLAPQYETPKPPVAAAWPGVQSNSTEVVTTNPVADIPWREFIQDSKLQSVIELALENNRDLRIATLNIDRAQALYQVQRADHFPGIKATGSASKQRIPGSLSSTGSAMTPERYDIGLGFSAYELDLFGRVQGLKDQALERYLATEHAQQSARISLIAGVANAYLALAGDQERMKLAQETFQAQKAATDLIRRRYEVGAASEIDLRRSETSVEAARGDIARYMGTIATGQNMLTLLVGAAVPIELLPQDLSSLATLTEVAPGLPADVLQHRPDILQAESLLRAANANIGVARAAFFPRIVLTAGMGTASDELSGLFKSGSQTLNFLPSLSVPIFEAGRNKANLKVAKVDRDIAVAQYEKAIQTAFREVADALLMLGTVSDQLRAQQALVDATAATFHLAEERYNKGVDSQLAVLDAQRSLYGAQQGLISLRMMQLTQRLNLYKALGGD